MRNALAGGGALLAVAAFLAGSLFGETTQPIETTTEIVAESPASQLCPDGWKDTSTEDETHLVVYSCSKGDYLVILTPTGEFNYAIQTGNPRFITNSTEVPGWD